MTSAPPIMPQSEPAHYSLQVVSVTDIHKRSRGSRLYVEVNIGKAVHRTGDIDDDGQPGWHATFTFSQLDDSSVFTVGANESRKLIHDRRIGDATITVVQLLQESAQHDVQLVLQRAHRLGISRKDPDSVGAIHVSFKRIDGLSRADIDVEAAEQSIARIKMSAEKAESSVTVIGSVIQAMDLIVEVVDTVAEINPVFKVSWKAVSAIYKLVSHQFENDRMLVELVDKMKNAHDLSKVAERLNDKTELLKPILKRLLDVTVKCSRFVRNYAKHSFTSRAVRVLSKEEIGGFTARFDGLRKELDSAIGLNTAAVVQDIQQEQQTTGKVLIDIELKQQLDALKDQLGLAKFNPVDVSTCPRCLEGTREEYLGPITGFLSSETTPNVLWLTGAAGSGKSTIAVTASDRWGEEGEDGYEAAHLFFRRERADYSTAIRAIAYKLAVLHPSIARYIIGVVKKSKNITDLPLTTQFEKLLLKPLQATARRVAVPIVVILDALDESGSDEQRHWLLALLGNNFARLPSKVRVLITSRPENDIVKALSKKGHIRRISLDHTSGESRRDVARHIRLVMGAIFGERAARDREWDTKMQKLSDAAGGLFIWASMAIKMVQSSDDTQEQLDTVLEDIGSVGEYGIDLLYATALKTSGISWDLPKSKDRFTRVLGLVLIAKEALSGETIEAFLGLEKGKVDLTLARLRSVLSYEPGHPVRLHHASFADYLLSPERSRDQPWHIDEFAQKQAVAEQCFVVMGRLLRFNICDIESSFACNNDVPGLRGRIKDRIPPHLEYACRFWAVHTCELSNSIDHPELLKKLKTFMEKHLLYWFEILSLTDQYKRVAPRALNEVTLWTAHINGELSSFLRAAYWLARVFACPISESAPQVYLSALSFWTGMSRVADHYSRMHPYISADRYRSKLPGQFIWVIRGHQGFFSSATFSPDGRRVASGSSDNRVRIWDADSGKLVSAPFKGHTGWVMSVAFSPDGRRVVSGSGDKTIHVWNVDSGELVAGPFDGHTKAVNSVAFSRDGKRIVSGSDDKTIRIWDAVSGKLISGPFGGHTDWVTSVAFSPDGRLVVSGSFDKTVRVWDADSGRLVLTPFEGHTGWVMSVAFSPDGKRVVSGSSDKTVCIWDVDNGELVLGPLEGHTDWARSVAFSPDGMLVVSGSYDRTIRVWDAVTGQPVSSPYYGHFGAVKSVTFSTDSRRILSCSDDSTIRIWDVRREESSVRYAGTPSQGVPCTTFDELVPSNRTVQETKLNAHKSGLRSPEGRQISDWRLKEDGWVVTDQGELLTWVPKDMRRTLWGCRNTAVFGCRFSTKLVFSSAPVGVGWYKSALPRER